MPSINLSIEAESVAEFDQLIARFMPGMTIPAERFPPQPEAAAEPAAGKGRSSRSTKSADAAPTAAAGSAVSAASADAVDPFAAAATSSNAAGAASDVGASTGSETISATPSATSPESQADVTIDMLKSAMGDLLKAKSASFAMTTLEAASGCKSLTTGSPSVVEKAKDDPALFRKVYEALTAAAK